MVPTAAPTQSTFDNVSCIHIQFSISISTVVGESQQSVVFKPILFILQGYVYVNFYEESGCTGNIVSVEGRPTNVCLQAYGDVNSATVTGSYIFTCAGGNS